MIQRIQTLLLAFVPIFNGIFFITPLYEKLVADPALWLSILFWVSLAATSLLSIYSIFLYSNRSKQIQFVKFALIPQVILLGSGVGVILTLGGIGSYLWDESLSLVLILIAFVFQILAIRFIRKDEALVRSMDRIR